MNFGWWKVRAGNHKAGKQESRRFLIPVLPEGFPHVKHFGMEPRPSHMVSGARPRRRSTHVPPHAWGRWCRFRPWEHDTWFSCNPHASPLGTLQPPRHTWCVCNALGKARPGALHHASHATDGRRGQRHIRLSTAQAVTDRRRVFAAPHRHEPTNQSRTSATAPTAGGSAPPPREHHRSRTTHGRYPDRPRNYPRRP